MNNMIQIRNVLIRSTFVVALAGLASLPTAALAQMKGASQLIQLKPAASLKSVESVSTTVMSCPTCKDSWVTVVEKTGKAVKPEIQHRVLSHKCPGCADATVIKGHGKAKIAMLAHTCKESGSKDASCCAMK